MPPISKKGNLYVHFLHKSFLEVLEIEYFLQQQSVWMQQVNITQP